MSILENGLLSHNLAYKNKLLSIDISDYGVQERRQYKRDPIFKKPLHSYASLYFNPRNPMLYRLRAYQNELVILGVNPKVLRYDGTIFTDGNAASSITRFYSGLDDLDLLPWNVIFGNPYWYKHEDGKRIFCAEVLVPKQIEPYDIDRIICNNKLLFDNICNAITYSTLEEVNEELEIQIDRRFFF